MPTFVDRIAETWTGTGTGTITLSGTAVSGPPGGFRAFSGNVTNGATVRILIEHQTTTEWEISEGVYDSGAGTVTRATVKSSSNSGSLVNFSAGTKHVAIVDDAAWMSTVVTVSADGGAGALLATNGSGTRSFTTYFFADSSSPTLAGYAYSATDAPAFRGFRSRGTSGSPSAIQTDDSIIQLSGRGYGATAFSSANRATLNARAGENWTDSAQGTYWQWVTTTNGGTTTSEKMRLYLGLQLGSPTGGDKGAGTINVATGIYLNNTAYTNPHYVFEHYFTQSIVAFAGNKGADKYEGLWPLEKLEAYTREHHHFPQIDDQPAEVGDRFDTVLILLEQLSLYLFEQNKRIKALEARAN